MLLNQKNQISLLIILFILSTILPQIVFAQNQTEIALIEDLSKIELQVFGEVKDESILNRVEFLEKELVGRTLPGIIIERIKQLKDFILIGTSDEPSLSFKINSVEMSLQEKTTDVPLLSKIENLELMIFGQKSEDVIAMRAEKIFNVVFPEGKPVIQEMILPAGTLIPVVLMEDLGSKRNDDGDLFEYQVADDIFYSESLIIPKNTVGRGEVINAKKASILLKKGKLELDFRSIETLDGTPIHLVMGDKAKEENTRIGLAVGASVAGLIILSNPIGLIAGAFIPGKNIKLDEGTKLYLEVAGDTRIMALSR